MKDKFYKSIDISYKNIWVLPILIIVAWDQFIKGEHLGAIFMSLIVLLLLYISFGTLIDRRIHLSINEEGMFYRKFKFGNIAWHDINIITPQQIYTSISSEEASYSGVFLIELINKEDYIKKIPITFKYDPQYKKDKFEFDINNLTASTEDVLNLLEIYLSKEMIHDNERLKEMEESLNREAREIALKHGQAYTIDGKIYSSIDDMPKDVREKHYENERRRNEHLNQTKKFKVNGIEYDSFEEIPEEYKEDIKEMMEGSEHDGKYALETNN